MSVIYCTFYKYTFLSFDIKPVIRNSLKLTRMEKTFIIHSHLIFYLSSIDTT